MNINNDIRGRVRERKREGEGEREEKGYLWPVKINQRGRVVGDLE